MLLAVIHFFTVNAQNKNDDNKVRVKIYSNNNGKIVNIDTTFENEKSANAFLKKNKLDKPEPPAPPSPPAPPTLGIAPAPPAPPLPPDSPSEKRSSNKKSKHIEIYSDKEMHKDMQELKKEMEKLQGELSEQMEELKDFHFEFYDIDDDNKDGKNQRIIIKNFDNGTSDTIIELNFPDWDEMDIRIPCLDSAETGYKYFYKIDDDDKSTNGDNKRDHQTVIITKEGKNDIKWEKRKKNDKKNEKKKAEEKSEESNNYKLNPEKFSLSPNPGNGKYNLRFSLSSNEPITIRVIDVSGTEVYSEKIKNFSGNYNEQLNIEGRLPGSYVLQIRQNEKLFTQKFVLN